MKPSLERTVKEDYEFIQSKIREVQGQLLEMEMRRMEISKHIQDKIGELTDLVGKRNKGSTDILLVIVIVLVLFLILLFAGIIKINLGGG